MQPEELKPITTSPGASRAVDDGVVPTAPSEAGDIMLPSGWGPGISAVSADEGAPRLTASLSDACDDVAILPAEGARRRVVQKNSS